MFRRVLTEEWERQDDAYKHWSNPPKECPKCGYSHEIYGMGWLDQIENHPETIPTIYRNNVNTTKPIEKRKDPEPIKKGNVWWTSPYQSPQST